MTASLDSAESQCIWSERHVTSCRGGQVELVVWLAQMVPAMPSILGDRSRIRTGRIWRWCRMAPPPRRVRANHCALRLCRSRLFARTSIRRDLNHLLAVSGLTDASNRPLTFTPHDFRRLFATDALRSGLPPHIAAKVLGHLDLGTTLGYAAVYSEDVVTHHRAFIARRRGLRPAEEYRDLSPEEWDQFLSHFELRKVALGTCTRDFGTPCLHEHSCIRCPLLRPDPAQTQRLVEIRDNLHDRITEARREGWLGEVAGLETSLAAAEQKLQAARQLGARPTAITNLGMPGTAARAER